MGIFASLITTPLFAATDGNDLPWNTPLQTIQSWLTGSIAHWTVIIAIAIAGLSFAFGEHGGIFRKGAAIVLGGSIAAGAMQIAMALSIAGAMA